MDFDLHFYKCNHVRMFTPLRTDELRDAKTGMKSAFSKQEAENILILL